MIRNSLNRSVKDNLEKLCSICGYTVKVGCDFCKLVNSYEDYDTIRVVNKNNDAYEQVSFNEVEISFLIDPWGRTKPVFYDE